MVKYENGKTQTHLKMTMILSSSLSNSSSDDSLFPCFSFESTNFAISSAGLFCLTLMKDSNDSFMLTMNCSFEEKDSACNNRHKIY